MKEKVAVAMSGGVDSSAAAAILLRQGFEVIGLTLNLFAPDNNAAACCGAGEAGPKARAVCDLLGIRHYQKNAVEVFQKKVINEFISSYSRGETPNPCIECNRFVKFEYLFLLAKALGAKYLATGHYAIISPESGYSLKRGSDPLKDQSYFLYCLKKKQLPEILFPLGGLAKKEVRKLALDMSLPTAKDKESNDICFVGDGGYERFLRKHGGMVPRPGKIINSEGKLLGRHEGFFNYTVGQRRGLGVYGGERLYVTAIRPDTNEVVIGTLNQAHFSSFELINMNWLADKPEPGAVISAQIRYRHTPAYVKTISVQGSNFSGVFREPQFAPTLGQSVVFYDGDRVIGGGVISAVS